MLLRPLGAALGLALLLSGCGHSGSGYGSTQDVATAMNCTPTGSPEAHPNHGYTMEYCTLNGHPTSVYWHTGKHAEWVGMGGTKASVVGTHWVVECSNLADCMKAHRVIGGTFIRQRLPASGNG